MITEKKSLPKPKQWAEMEALWELGEITRDDIAKKLNVTPTAVTIHMKKVGVVRGSKAEEHRKKISKATTEAATTDASIFAQRIRETKDSHYKMSEHLAKMAFSEVLTAQRDKTPLSVVTSNLKALDVAVTVIAKARQERWAVLGLDRPDTVDTNDLPSLVIEELTAEQIEELRARDFNNFEEIDLPEGNNESSVVQDLQSIA